MSKFKVGDRVVVMVKYLDIPVGRIGTIAELYNEELYRISNLYPDYMEDRHLFYRYTFFFHELRLATPLDEVLS